MSRSDLQCVQTATTHLRALYRHLERGNLDNETVADAVILRLAATIDALAAGSPELRARLFGDDWHPAWSTRNTIVHSYLNTDVEVIRATIRDDLPKLEAAMSIELGGE
jgi:uncharacterized protein with HEPN domain